MGGTGKATQAANFGYSEMLRRARETRTMLSNEVKRDMSGADTVHTRDEGSGKTHSVIVPLASATSKPAAAGLRVGRVLQGRHGGAVGHSGC